MLADTSVPIFWPLIGRHVMRCINAAYMVIGGTGRAFRSLEGAGPPVTPGGGRFTPESRRHARQAWRQGRAMSRLSRRKKSRAQLLHTGAHCRKLEPSLHAENGFATSWAQSMKSLANGLSVRFFIVMISIANG
jgi:hypothetical protein